MSYVHEESAVACDFWSVFDRLRVCSQDRKTGDFGGDCGGNFLTGAGGFLQGLWAGWAGMRLRVDSLDFVTPRMPATTDGMKLRGISYLDSKFDLVLSNKDDNRAACFKSWPVVAGGGGFGLKIGTLGSGSFATLSADAESCFKVGSSVRIIGAAK